MLGMADEATANRPRRDRLATARIEVTILSTFHCGKQFGLYRGNWKEVNTDTLTSTRICFGLMRGLCAAETFDTLRDLRAIGHICPNNKGIVTAAGQDHAIWR